MIHEYVRQKKFKPRYGHFRDRYIWNACTDAAIIHTVIQKWGDFACWAWKQKARKSIRRLSPCSLFACYFTYQLNSIPVPNKQHLALTLPSSTFSSFPTALQSPEVTPELPLPSVNEHSQQPWLLNQLETQLLHECVCTRLSHPFL